MNSTVLEADQSTESLEAVRGTLVTPTMQGIQQYNAAEAPEPTDAPPERLENEPHGMYWHKMPSGELALRPHSWFVADIAVTADAVFVKARESMTRDTEAHEWIAQLSDSLSSYIQTRTAINDKAGERKLKQEADDAAYQLCQAAKYYMDAQERAKRDIDRGLDLDSDTQLLKLRDMTETAMREGYILACAVTQCSDMRVAINFATAAKRVADYSAKRLTDWFAVQRSNASNSKKRQQAGAVLDLSKFLQRKSA